MYGYSGKILHVDLTNRKWWAESKPEEWSKIDIGGVSRATRLCWENIEPGCDPLSPANPLCISNGIFAGTPVPVGGKYGIANPIGDVIKAFGDLGFSLAIDGE